MSLFKQALSSRPGANKCITTHHLDFEIAKWKGDPSLRMFRVGTVEGLYGHDKESIFIVAILNPQSGNGHLEDVFEWFEYACRKSGKKLVIKDLWNDRFRRHLLRKRGFMPVKGKNEVEKYYE